MEGYKLKHLIHLDAKKEHGKHHILFAPGFFGAIGGVSGGSSERSARAVPVAAAINAAETPVGSLEILSIAAASSPVAAILLMFCFVHTVT